MHERHNYSPFVPYRMKIEKVDILVANLNGKTEHVIHIINLKQTFKSWISFEKSSLSD